MDQQQLNPRRRDILTTAATMVLAGCLEGGNSGGEADADIQTHPAVTGAEASPRMGPDSPVPETMVVAFSDPSCPQCALFAEQTFPDLRHKFIEPGRMAYIWRALPTVEPWATRAVAALLAAHRRDKSAFWWLKTRFHEQRSSITDDNIIDRVITWLDTRDGVDTAEVQHDIENGRFDEHIAADGRSADQSDVDAVPSFVLFRQEEFVTVVVGPHSTDVFASALDL